MAQHFLLSAKARTLCLAQISAMSESKCCEYFRHIRWQSNNGKPICDECGSVRCYAIKTRKQYRCKECFHTFSVTSNTLFHSHKISFKSMLIFYKMPQGISIYIGAKKPYLAKHH